MNTTYLYHSALGDLRAFFTERGFIEVLPQHRLSILAACEDPHTISMFEFAGKEWPLPQTGQMWLEKELMENPDFRGVFCVSTSYRNEPNPIPGRHDLIFPMFEFESKGDVNDLIELEANLIERLNLYPRLDPYIVEYEEVCKRYHTNHIDAREEGLLSGEHEGAVFITKFPARSDPFWNMKEDGDTFNKVDVIIEGMETIGSAERSCDPRAMRRNFHAVSNGKYAERLFELFGEDRVMGELGKYLSLKMFPRFGGGIGLTRLIRGIQSVREGI